VGVGLCSSSPLPKEPIGSFFFRKLMLIQVNTIEKGFSGSPLWSWLMDGKIKKQS